MGEREKGRPGPVAGIVCEYNPFHLGHAWMIEELRRSGAEAVVCVMSGPFVQRAEAACLPVQLRARAAVQGGADLVFRLPLPWACASAEGFARGAVGLLAALGCVDSLAFGAETADTARLCALAEGLESGPFRTALRGELEKGGGFAAARAAAAEAVLPGAGALLASPNNILGVEYCKALLAGFPLLRQRGLAALPRPLALPRHGAAHDGRPAEGIASASWLRAAVGQGGAETMAAYVPKSCAALYQKAEQDGAFTDPGRYELMLLSRLRGLTAGQLAGHPGAGEGLENRLFSAIRQACSLEELYTLAKTKRFAHSRVRRLALSAALGIPQAIPALPPFLHLMAASTRGLALLKRARQTAVLPLGTSLAKLAQTGEGARQLAALEARAEDLHALCRQKPAPGGGAFTQPVQLPR